MNSIKERGWIKYDPGEYSYIGKQYFKNVPESKLYFYIACLRNIKMLLYLRSINILLAKEHKNIPYMKQQKNTPSVLITLFQICCHLGMKF